MASGRVGGTRSKIRGQVGDIIYQVVRNQDGTYTQISYGKPEDITQTITPRLQAQRMCTSMVEALMRDLRPIGNISMQSGTNKSKSLNAFSSFNLQLVAQDCKAHWYSDNSFFFPTTSNIGTPSEQLGGRFMLSSGTWQYNGFDSLEHMTQPWRIWSQAGMVGKRFCGLRFSLDTWGETVGKFLQRHHMSSLDQLCFACFHDWIDSVSSPDDPVYRTRHSYIIAQINSAIPPEWLIGPETLSQLFICQSDWEVFRAISDDRKSYYIGLLVDNENDDAYFYTYGGFTISKITGKKLISSSRMMFNQADTERYLANHAPADVFGTWMGEPSIKPYPSPF